MKIGILTLQYSNNFGANLQAYALQEAIKKMDIDCELINYHNQSKKKNPIPLISKISDRIKNILLKASGGAARTRAFQNSYMQLSPKFNEKTIEEANGRYDKFIVGSDQVWNIRLTEGDLRYFLDFVTDDYKKNSYAASIALSSFTQEETEILRPLLAKFKGLISVREKAAQKLLESQFNISSTEVLDPTLLLSQKDWESVAAQKRQKQKYVLIYQMGRSKTLVDFATRKAKQIGAKIISIRPPLDNFIHGKNYYGAGPKEFVRLFLDAEMVVTNSFHGTVFALNFNKNLYVELLKKGDVNTRLTDVLTNCGIQYRILGTQRFDENKEIDYSYVNSYLNTMREVSTNVLKEICNA